MATGRADRSVLQVCLRYYEHELVELACQCPAVVCCRCSPTQKAHIVRLLQRHTHKRTCAIGERPPPRRCGSQWPRPVSCASWGKGCHSWQAGL